MASAKKTILGLDLSTWVFLLPALLFFAGYQLFPIVRVVWISFTDFKYLTNDPPNWIGFANYIEAVNDPLMWKSLGRAAYFTVLFLPGTIIFPLLLAVLVDRVRNAKVATVYRVILLIPAVIPSTLVFVLWKWMYNYQIGPINYFLVEIMEWFTYRNAPQWLGGTDLTLPSVAMKSGGVLVITVFFSWQGLQRYPKIFPKQHGWMEPMSGRFSGMS